MLASCGQDASRKVEESIMSQDALQADQKQQDLNRAKQIFYSLPSPIETAMLIRRSGVEFDPELLNRTENYANYTTTLKKALNLGIYCADLSYASIFDQTQTTVQYMGISKILAQELDILSAIDESIVRRLEANVNHRDSIMDIISETFMNSDSYLKENGRPETAALMLTGGWVEGLYIAVRSADKNGSDDLVDRIIDQKISLGSVLQLLESYKGDPNVARVYADIQKIAGVFESFDVVYSHIETLTDPDDRSTVLKARTEVFKSANALKSLDRVVDSLRNAYVN